MPQSFSQTLVRPADTTQYAIGDLVANSTTAGSVSLLRFGNIDGVIETMTLRKTTNVTTAAAFRLWLWAAPAADTLFTLTVTNGDNGAFVPSTWENFIGRLSCTAMEASPVAAGAWARLAPDDGSRYLVTGQRLFGLLEARGAYAPGSAENFILHGVAG